jgi:hypothetical protein
MPAAREVVTREGDSCARVGDDANAVLGGFKMWEEEKK